MGIYIKGMEMPTHCSVCKFFDHGDCELLPYGDYIDDKHQRRDNCPLIELPSHGRLIDADAAIANRNVNMNWCYDLCDLPDYLADCPTIIESEGEDMDSFIRIFEEDSEEDGMDSFIRILKD